MDKITQRLTQDFESVLYLRSEQPSMTNSKREGSSDYMENALP